MRPSTKKKKLGRPWNVNTLCIDVQSFEELLRILATPASLANGATDHTIMELWRPLWLSRYTTAILVPPAVYSTFNEAQGPDYGGTEYRCNNATILH